MSATYYSLARVLELGQNKDMQVSVIIPAINEAESIGQVLSEVPRDSSLEILVVDGGSQDGTVAIAEAAGARVIHEPRRGYGRACATGVAQANGELVVFMDADGADDPTCLPQLTAPILSGQTDMVLGSRLLGGVEQDAMPWHQYFGNWLSAYLIRRLYGLAVTDLSPFRAVNRQKLSSLQMAEMTYGWPTEMIVKAARQDWRILEIPMTYYPRLGGKSKISGTLKGTVFATYDILRMIFKYSR